MLQDTAPIDSVLLVGFGAPTKSEDVMPFLRLVVRGRGVTEERLQAVAHHYDAVGGRSPYNELSEHQAASLERWLEQHGNPLPVYLGMRNWHPFLAETIHKMKADGCRHAAGVILAPHRSQTSWERYMEDVRRAVETAGGGPHVTYLPPWPDDPGFLEATAQNLEKAAGFRRGAWPAGAGPADVPVIFTAHSIPVAMALTSPYVTDLQASCAGVARVLGIGADGWRLAYQSRSGDKREPWLEPDILDALRDCAATGATCVVVQAIGFLIDHVEVLYDLDVEAAQLAGSLGIRFVRASCVNSHPEFVAMLGRRILTLAGGIV